MDATLKAFSSGSVLPKKQPLQEPIEAAPSQPETLETVCLEKIPYRCASCERGLTLEEHTTVICSCGWRIVLKDQKKMMRTFSTD
jgi:DNA-directed RNA polymerase subunit RPC12/RpoP